MNRFACALPLSLSLSLALTLSAGCNDGAKPSPEPVPAAAPAAAGDAAPTPAKTAAGADGGAKKSAAPGAASSSDAGREACQAFADRMCKEAGPDAQTCDSVKLTAGLLQVAACDAALANIDEAIKRLAGTKASCTELIGKLCGDLGTETATCAMVKEKTAAFPPSRCQQMLGDYDKVLGQLQSMEAANKPLSAELLAKQTAKGAPDYGPADAALVVVEYSDFQCPYCSRAATAMTDLKKKYGDKVRFVFRQFPLSFHQNAMPAAEASLEALAQGKFWEMHDMMFANQGSLARTDIEGYAAKVGMDVAKLKAALDKGTHKATVEADMELGKQVGVQGTPSLFIGAERASNPSDVAAVSAQIDKALAAAGK